MNQTIAQIIAASGNRFANNDQDFDILLEALDLEMTPSAVARGMTL